MAKKNKQKSAVYGIIGLGRFGYALAVDLANAGYDLIVLDRDEEKICEMRAYTENAFIVGNMEKKTLLDTGIQNCDVAVVCIGEQMDISILTTLNLVSMNIPKVIARATSVEHGVILEKLGAEVVYPERDMAIRLASRLETARMLDIVQLSERINVMKMEIPTQAVGKTVAEVHFRARFDLNIIGIENGGKLVEVVRPDYAFCSGDILFLCGSKDGLLRLNAWAEN